MADTSQKEDERHPPRRLIGKQEAIRHLLHSAIRLIMKQEDPFAIHLVVHSADKMILDVAKMQGHDLRVDWELYIKDQYRKEFFQKHRETYNYLKHAKQDVAKDLPVHDIMMLNVMTLFIAITNYTSLFKELSDHMRLFHIFVMNLSPAIIGHDFPQREELLKNIKASQTMTPRSFFETFQENPFMLPEFVREVANDLQDITDFYNLSFSDLQAGRTKSARMLRVPG